MTASNKNPLVLRRLYRSLLRAAKPFTHPSPDAAVLGCLLHRTGQDDSLPVLPPWTTPTIKVHIPRHRTLEEARDLSKSYATDDDDDDDDDYDDEEYDDVLPKDGRRAPHRVMFRRLLREVVTGPDGYRQMQYPSEVDTERLKRVIQREFRREIDNDDDNDASTRQQVAFLALRELNKKLSWLDQLLLAEAASGHHHQDNKLDMEHRHHRNQRQAARHVTPLPLDPPSSYLQSGTYLIAHPLLTGYFYRTVICLLDHTEGSKNASSFTKNNNGGTYGLIVNRIGVSPASGKRRTLREILRTLPPQLARAFGNCTIREGGPVHMSLQMVHARTPQQAPIGGTVLEHSARSASSSSGTTGTSRSTTRTATTTEESPPPQQQHNGGDLTSSALYTDRAIYYQGNIEEAADAVINGDLDRDDVSFYVGASCWETGQLQSEIERGYWFVAAGPPEIALSGMCERNGDDDLCSGPRPKADLWLSMMCALGDDEANLAHLLYHQGGGGGGLGESSSEYDEPCDAF